VNLLFAPSHDKDSEMARFNEELIAQRIAEIRQAMALLEPYAQMSQQQFLTNREAVDAAKYRLLMGVESCAQVSSHLFSRLKGQAPDSIPSCFEQLSELGVVSAGLAARLVQMARFRNMLVHRYQLVDDFRVYQIVQQSIQDWEAFIDSVQVFVKGQKHAPP
jgi:uncharacterized protein YutE (UPF0331/DUF86 family)